ncbi:YfcE family phosphodiesterase [Bacillus lacus]|uniref:Phosphoesterase n=1 Tax=Metabacillus lacus TaxID=1983721 RepID=A0A7X2IYQ3_9BACI|nr:metallophosphoesterase family protein [Metabacillus lacus]MRX71593.1 YfcE family phosphodiesterase [Metabacillus lacus]
MRVVVLSDTHMPRMAKQFPAILREHLHTADLIIHAGDFQTMEVVRELQKYAKIAGVAGNVDSSEVAEALGDKKIIECEGYRIGIVHGHGKGRTTEERVLNSFEGEDLDCIIFGHSHIPVNKMVNKTLLFNPGSPTDKRRQNQYSFGVLEFHPALSARLIMFDSKQP